MRSHFIGAPFRHLAIFCVSDVMTPPRCSRRRCSAYRRTSSRAVGSPTWMSPSRLLSLLWARRRSRAAGGPTQTPAAPRCCGRHETDRAAGSPYPLTTPDWTWRIGRSGMDISCGCGGLESSWRPRRRRCYIASSGRGMPMTCAWSSGAWWSDWPPMLRCSSTPCQGWSLCR